MAIQPVGIENLDRLGIDPTTGKLFWDNQEVVTTLSLPWVVNVAIVAGAVIAGLSFVWSVTKYVLDRRRNSQINH